LHQHRRVTFEIAGRMTVLELPYRSAGEYAEQLVR